MNNVANWSPEEICLHSSGDDLPEIAKDLYRRTCRTSFEAPGFCLLNFGCSIDSTRFRRLMVELANCMSEIHEQRVGDSFVYLSAARFDQQTSTKPHLDAGPTESFLMLGY